jgi:hypothetical protein
MNIKNMVENGKKVKFISYREGEFIYSTECGFEFPVPLADIGKATLLAEDKALLFLRYIRKHVEMLKSSSVEEVGSVEGTVNALKELISTK